MDCGLKSELINQLPVAFVLAHLAYFFGATQYPVVHLRPHQKRGVILALF